MHKRSSSRAESSRSHRIPNPHIPTSTSREVKNELITAGAQLYTLLTELTVLLNEVLEDKDEKENGKSLYFILLYSRSILAGIDLVNKLCSCSNALRDSTALVSLLQGVISSETETEMQRASGKVDRALERLRRCITSFLDRSSCTNDQVFLNAKELFSVIIDALSLTISEVIMADINSNGLLTLVSGSGSQTNSSNVTILV